MPMQSTTQQPAWSDHYIIALTGHRPKDVFVRNGSQQPYENPYDHTNSRWQALQQQLAQTIKLTHFDPATLGFSVPKAGDVKSRDKTTERVSYDGARHLA